MSRQHWFGALALLGLGTLALAGCGAPGAARAPASQPTAAGERVEVRFYVMSQCPFAAQVETAIAPVLAKLGPAVDFQLDYVVDTQGGTLRSLHGESEVKGDIVQLCAAHVAPDRVLKMVVCQARSLREVPDNWERCAKEAGIDAVPVRACYTGEEGKRLLRESAQRAAAAKVTASPTMLIGGRPYEGRRLGSDFLRAICGAFRTRRPAACAEVKPVPPVRLVVVNDRRCEPCGQVAVLVEQLRGVFPGLQPRTVDFGTPEGRRLYAEAGLTHLPALLFDASVEADADGFGAVQRYLRPAGKYRTLPVGATFDPRAEICTNGIDDTGNGKVDCADPGCAQSLPCRSEQKGRLDLFVMSQCPYGVRALDALREVLRHFSGQKVELGIHYIANATPDGFQSLHGQPEVDENIRAVCAMHHYPKAFKFMDYIWCRNRNIRDAAWESCAQGGIDRQVMKRCATGPEGKTLLRENIRLANSLKVSASPSWLVNNKYPFAGLDAETIKRHLCQHNPQLKGCDARLSGPSSEEPGAGSCAE